MDRISEATFSEILGEVPTKEIEKSKLDGAGLPLVELLVHAGLCPSKGQARKDIEGGGVNINNVRESNFQRAVTSNDLFFGKHLLLRKGKKNYVVLTVEVISRVKTSRKSGWLPPAFPWTDVKPEPGTRQV